MKRTISLIIVAVMFLAVSTSAYAAGNVIYEKDAGSFIFEYGSDRSETDLFSDFKDVMPGDSITQKITVRNDASERVKIKIYMRSLGAQEGSEEFLSQLDLKVSKSEDNKMAYMFDAKADETATLSDWVLLGTLYSGGEVNLNVTLSIPTELDNTYANKIGYLDWEFKVEEFPIEETDPKPPQTSDSSNLTVWYIIFAISASVMFFFIIVLLRKKQRGEQSA